MKVICYASGIDVIQLPPEPYLFNPLLPGKMKRIKLYMKIIVPKMKLTTLIINTTPTCGSPSVPSQANNPIKPAIAPNGAAIALIGKRIANRIVRFVSCRRLVVTANEGTIVISTTYLPRGMSITAPTKKTKRKIEMWVKKGTQKSERVDLPLKSENRFQKSM